MLQLIRSNNESSNSLVAHLLASTMKYRDQVADLLTSSAEQRLANVLFRLAHLGTNGGSDVEIPFLHQKVLAEMVGTTRARINFFMNLFRRQGFINYDIGVDGRLEVNQSLHKVLRAR